MGAHTHTRGNATGPLHGDLHGGPVAALAAGARRGGAHHGGQHRGLALPQPRTAVRCAQREEKGENAVTSGYKMPWSYVPDLSQVACQMGERERERERGKG